MCRVLGVTVALKHFWQNLLELCTGHNPLSPITALPSLLTAFRPLRLCSCAASRGVSSAPCATVICYCRWNIPPYRQFHCAQNPLYHAEQKSFYTQEVTPLPRVAAPVDPPPRPARGLALPVPSSATPRRFPWSLPAGPRKVLSSAAASGRRLPPSGAARWKRPIRLEKSQSFGTTAGKLPGSGPRLRRCWPSCASITSTPAAYAGCTEPQRLLHRPA